MQNASQTYKNVAVGTASQGKLIVMLFEGAIKRTRLAMDLLNSSERRLDQVNNHLLRAQDIIAELRGALNFDAGDIANNLNAAYVYIQNLLIKGNITKSVEPLNEAIEHMSDLRDTWQELFTSIPAESPPPRPTQAPAGNAVVNVTG